MGTLQVKVLETTGGEMGKLFKSNLCLLVLDAVNSLYMLYVLSVENPS